MKIYVAALLLVTQAVVPATGLGTSTAYGPTSTLPNEDPLAEAGLDQNVTLGQSVLLDGRGSRDPDGTVDSYEWLVTTPSGTSSTPDCIDCPRTTFVPNETGTYEVQLLVEDGEGATDADTLFVRVVAGAGPTVSLSAPSSVSVGDTTTVTADVESGAAELNRIEWVIDGSVVKTNGLSGDVARPTIEPAFPDSGAHTVTARVYDEGDRTAADSRPITVTAPPGYGPGPGPGPGNGTSPGPGNGTSPGPGNGTGPTPGPGPAPGSGNGSSPNVTVPPAPGGPGSGGGGSGGGGSGNGSVDTLAEEHNPVVDGPRVVTGALPLAATYGLGNSPPMDDVESVTWFDGGGVRGDGAAISLDWEPGDRRFFAVVEYTDGSMDVVRFPDGSTVVVADPEPSVALSNLHAGESIVGTVTAGDEYGNLVEVTVSVDGRQVLHREAQRAGRRPTLGDRVDGEFEHPDAEPNESYEVVVEAADGRGQTAVLRRTVDSPGELEVVRAGFVNTPVDSYHERLDPARYTAHHIVEVRLNGNDAEDVEIDHAAVDRRLNRLENGRWRRTVDGSGDILHIHSYWSGWSPGRYELSTEVESSRSEFRSILVSDIMVEPSDPELILTTESAGTEERTQDWGIFVNASRSFDPDHTTLNYTWTHGAKPVDGQPSVGEFRALENGDLEVNDENGGFSAQRCCFLQYFVPAIEEVDQLDQGPFNATDTVRFEVRSSEWATSRMSRDYELNLGYVSSSRYVDIVSQEQRVQNMENVAGGAEDFRLLHRRAIVEVQAAALHEGTDHPSMALVNERGPERIRTNVTFPTVEVHNETTIGIVRNNISVESIAYKVRRENGTREVEVTDRRELQTYLREGFEIAEERTRATAIQLERKTEREEERTSRIAFGTPGDRRRFLQNNLDWRSAGTQTTSRTGTTTEIVWRSSRTGSGDYTGRTRVRTEPAQTRTLREYETRVQRSRTVTETVQKPYQTTVERTHERTVIKCNQFVGCREVTVTETVTETVTRYRPVTRTREITYWVESMYWARMARAPGDSATGRSKEVVFQPARETREYEFEITREHCVIDTRHFATRTTMETVEEWNEFRSVDDYVTAAKLSRRSDVRVGDVEEATTWVVQKSGRTTETVEEYEDPENVLETIAIVSGDVQEKELNPVTSETNLADAGSFREEIRREGVLSLEMILQIAQGDEDRCSDEVNCR